MYVGIDIAKLTFDVYFDTPNKHDQFYNNPKGFERFLACLKQPYYSTVICHLVMESTNIYWQALAKWAVECGFAVSVVNPLYIQAHAKSLGIRLKTDKQDAKLLAHYGRCHKPPLWYPKAVHYDTLDALTRQLLCHKNTLQTEKIRLQTAHPATRIHIQTNIAYWQRSITVLEQDIWHLIDSTPTLCTHAQLLKSIPGIGKKTIPLLLALIGDGSRFASAKHLVSYVGLAPRAYESGTSIKKQATIGFSGKPNIRQALFMPAMVVSFGRHRAFEAFVQRLHQKGKPKKQIIVAVMRKLLVIAYHVIKTNEPFDANRHP